MNKHKESIFSNEKLSDEETINLTYETSAVLNKIIALSIEYGNFKDDFDTSKMYLNVYGPCLIIKSKKTNVTFYLAIDYKGIYLETSFLHAENLKNMDDSFWIELFNLKKFKGFEYHENSTFPIDVQKKVPELFHTYKNPMFLMFRQFFLSHTENYQDIDLGYLRINWDSNDDFIEIITEISLAFKSMYSMSYKLWKVSDLRMKKK